MSSADSSAATTNAVASSPAPVSTSATMATLLEAASDVVKEEKGVADKQMTQATQDIMEKISVQSQQENKGDEEKSAYLEKEKIKLEETKY